MAAYVLTQAGADVILLEAGGPWDNTTDSAMLTWPYESPRRGKSTKERPFGEFDACIGGWEIEGEPFARAPGTEFSWWRARMVGGRTNHWGRISLRFGPYDFKRKSRDGLGDDWPISYEDVAPYYDKIDRLIGIFGSKENLPNEPNGVFLPPPKPRCHELLVKQAADKLRITCIPSRLSILTRPLNGRAACHYCGQCGRGCATHSNFSSPSVLLPPALATGKLKIQPNAMAREVVTDENGLATGVSYVDTKDRRRPPSTGLRHPGWDRTAERRRRLRQAAQGRLPQVLCVDRELRGPRRDGAKRELFLRDRSPRRRQLRHPGAALSLEVHRLRI